MDFGDISENIPLIVSILGLIVLQFFMRKKRPAEATQSQIAQNLLEEVKLNLRLTDIFTFDFRTKKFTTTTWVRTQNKLDFLSQAGQTALADAFMIAEDANQQISAAKKAKSASYMTSINISRLKTHLARSEEELENWLSAKTGSAEPKVEVPGMFSDFTGRG